MKEQFKAGKPRNSQYYGYEVVDILKKKKFLWITYWVPSGSPIKNHSAVDEVVYLLNNPEECDRRLKAAKQDLIDKGVIS